MSRLITAAVDAGGDAAVDPPARTPEDVAWPDDPGRARRLTWADLFQRAFREDLLVCQRCGGELRLVATILDLAVAERILRRDRTLAARTTAWPRGRGRAPQKRGGFAATPRLSKTTASGSARVKYMR
jgi:hypothetical protein